MVAAPLAYRLVGQRAGFLGLVGAGHRINMYSDDWIHLQHQTAGVADLVSALVVAGFEMVPGQGRTCMQDLVA